MAKRGAISKPRITADTTICVDKYFACLYSPLPFIWPIIAMPATPSPCASELIIMTIGPQYVTALAASTPTRLFINNPSINGISAWTVPIIIVGSESSITVVIIGPRSIISRLFAVLWCKNFSCILKFPPGFQN